MSPTTVLVVEDNDPLAELYRRWLDSSYRVEVANDGWEALDAIEGHDQDQEESTNRPGERRRRAAVDVVFLDRQMPGMSGDQVLATIRERKLACYVVVVSAIDPVESIFSLDFDEYLVKPVTYDDLTEAVVRGADFLSRAEEVRYLHRLLVKRRLIEARTTPTALAECDAYGDLLAHIDRATATVDGSVPGFDV